ncbi:MAG: hypothetical protein RL189_3170 [Pseudomonadota bacterium]|jgi:fatty acid desaturase
MVNSGPITRDDYKRLHTLTEHLHEPDLFVYWLDLLVTAWVAWSAIFVALTSTALSTSQLLAVVVAACGFYKGVNFVHEVSHHPRKLHSLSLAYNIFFGLYTRVLSYFGNSHTDHHSVKKFGTQLDPEYENWSRRHPANVFRPAIASFISPLLMFARIAVIPLMYLVASRNFLKTIVRRYSSIVMNMSYEYDKTDDETLARVKSLDLVAMSLTWLAAGLLFYFEILIEAALIQYTTLVIANMLGSFRALGVHRYISNFNPQPAQNQFFDSVSISDSPFSPLWGPLNSNYHSIHHLLPHLPYHAMKDAHGLLLKDERWSNHYRKTLEKNLVASLFRLWVRAAENRRRTMAANQSNPSPVNDRPNRNQRQTQSETPHWGTGSVR